MTPPRATPTLRRATPADAEALATLAARTFQAAFAADNDPADMAAYVRTAFAPARLRAVLEDPAHTVFLAYRPSTAAPVGYATLRAGPPHASVTGPRPVELERLYVDAALLGQGVGAELMHACLQAAAEAGYETLWLGVWERNTRARRFYARWGFTAVGTHVFQLGTDAQEDLVLARPLAP